MVLNLLDFYYLNKSCRTTVEHLSYPWLLSQSIQLQCYYLFLEEVKKATERLIQ